VQVPGEYTVDRWFDGLEAGRTFVTSGPLLQFEVNGAGMGEELRVAAVSAPVYVVVDGDSRTWNREAVTAIVERLIGALDDLQRSSLESVAELEIWESGAVWRRSWAAQLAALGQRIDEARARLRELAASAARGD
jgi:hypothetical protein